MKYLLYICSLLGFFTCTSNNQSADTSSGKMMLLDNAQFNQKLAELPSAQLVDVRTPEEVAAGAIPSAINMDFFSNEFESKIKTLDKNRPVLVYCKSGGRSGKTAKRLNKMGFKEVYDLKGGFSSWSK